MKRNVIAAILLFQTPVLFGQAPNLAGAPNLAAAPKTPTVPAGSVPGSVAPRPVLHIDGHVTNLGCGMHLEFDFVVQNTSSTPFGGSGVLRISGNGLKQPPLNNPIVFVSVGAIGGHASQAIHVKTSVAKVDCVAPQTFEVTMTQGVNIVQPHPQWDRDALELTTTPPTNCSATGGSSRQPHWSPNKT